MTVVPAEAVSFHPLSHGDPHGRLFEWEGTLCRGVSASWAPFYESLLADGTIQGLVEQGFLIETERTPLSVDGFSLVMRHRRVPFISYAYEWTASMLKEAALLVLDFNLALARRGLTTQDAHPANLLFDRCRPVFVDVGSIIAVEPHRSWPAYDEFCRFYLYPLYLMANGQERIARWLLHDTERGVLGSDFFHGARSIVPSRHGTVSALAYHARQQMNTLQPKLAARIPSSMKAPLKRMLESMTRSAAHIAAAGQLPRVHALHRLKAEVQSIRLPAKPSTWSDYYKSFPPFSPSPSWGPKHQSVWSALSRLKPQSVLDIGSNQGWHAELAARHGSDVVAFDTDEASIAALYERGKRDTLPLLPLIMDIRYPSPGSGLANESFSPATQRLQCDLVLALALTHHLVFKQNLILFEKMVRAIEVFSKRWLLIEFVAKDDPYVIHDWSPERHSWYSLEGFLKALGEKFQDIERLPSDSPSRILFLCRK